MELIWQWGVELSYLVLILAGAALGYFLPTGYLKKVSVVITVLVLVNGFSLVSKYQAFAKTSSIVYTDERFEQLEFRDKRNIIFILIDSLTSLEGLKLPGLEHQQFATGLRDREFVL